MLNVSKWITQFLLCVLYFYLTIAYCSDTPDKNKLRSPKLDLKDPFINQPFLSVRSFGARGDGQTDDTAAIQDALDTGGMIVFPKGVYRTTNTLLIRSNNTILMGHGPYATIIVYEGNDAAIKADSNDLKTLYWCRLMGLRIEIRNKNHIGAIVNWNSMQFSTIEDLWVLGSGDTRSIGILLEAVPGKTEATYNNIKHSYIGLVGIGIQFGYGANSNTVETSRIQPLPQGVGILLKGQMSNNRILNTGFEYPDNVSGGILIEGKVKNTLIQGNRFENLSYGWKITENGLNTVVFGNYYNMNQQGPNWLDSGKHTQNYDQEHETDSTPKMIVNDQKCCKCCSATPVTEATPENNRIENPIGSVNPS